MPLYDYLCKKCDRTSELLIRTATVPVCPHCGSQDLERLISKPVAPGKSKAIMAANRALAVKEGHASHYKKKGGKIVN